MKKIVYFSNHIRGKDASAGARSWHQARKIGAHYKLSVITPSIDPVTQQKVIPSYYAGLPKNVQVKTLRSIPNVRSSIFRRLAYYAYMFPQQLFYAVFIGRSDLIISMGLPITTLASAWVAAKIHRCPLVIDIRDFPFETAFELGYVKSRLFTHIAIRLEAFFNCQADLIVTNSPYYVNIISDRGVDQSRILLAPIGYDDFYTPTERQISESRKHLLCQLRNGTEFISCYAGTIGYAFPVEKILSMAFDLRNHPEFGFVIAGDGQRLESLKQVAKHQKLNIYFPGRVTKSDVMLICKSGDGCIYPSNNGNFSRAILGNKVFDYLGAEKPILYIGDGGAVLDLVLELDAGVKLPDETNEMIMLMSRLFKDKSFYEGKKPSMQILKNKKLTAEESAQTLLEAIDSLLKH